MKGKGKKGWRVGEQEDTRKPCVQAYLIRVINQPTRNPSTSQRLVLFTSYSSTALTLNIFRKHDSISKDWVGEKKKYKLQ